MKSIIKRVLIHTCIYFTLTSLLLLFIYWVVSKDTSHGIQPLAFLLMLPFSCFFSVANAEFSLAPMPKAVRVAIHYMLTVGGAFVCLYLPNRESGSTSSQGLVLFFAFTALYAAVMIPLLIISARAKRITRDETEYTSVYTKK